MNLKVVSHSRDISISASALCAITSFILLWSAGCSDDGPAAQPAQDTPDQEILLSIDSESVLVATCGDLLTVAGSNVLQCWRWGDLATSPREFRFDLDWLPQWKSRATPYPLNDVYGVMDGDVFVCPLHQKDDTFLTVRSLQDGGEIKRWSLGREWCCRRLRGSRDGAYMAIYVQQDIMVVPAWTARHRVGLIQGQSESVQWITEIQVRPFGKPAIGGIACSDNGEYVVAVGACEGGFIHVASVPKQGLLWEKVPTASEIPIGRWTVNFNDVCFSPDSTRVYVAGNTGLFCFDTVTGSILGQWEVPTRCMSVAVSPDGRLVAGALLANGRVYVWDADTGQRLHDIQSGQHSVYGLAFSPDGSLLATSGVMNTGVRIWSMSD